MPIQPSGGGGSGAPVDAPYATFGADATLTGETNLYSLQHINVLINSPGQVYGPNKDGAEPEWWDASANCTFTDEDTAGEAIAQKTTRVFKAITVADDAYGYQTLTFANGDLLRAGQTVVSFGAWVYCASASKASIGIYGTNLGLQESSQHTGSGTWEFLKVENVTLNAADTAIEARLIVDTGTAYITLPMLNPGARVLPWRPAETRFVPLGMVQALNRTGGDLAFTDLDCTAYSHPLAQTLQVRLLITEDGTVGSQFSVGHDDAFASDAAALLDINIVTGKYHMLSGFVMCNDSQVIRYSVLEQDADNDVTTQLEIVGYWGWVQ